MFHNKHKNTEDNKASSIPFFFGFVSGVIAGVLFAPDKGSVSRKKLRKTIKSLVDEFESSETGQKVVSNPKVVKATKNLKDVKDEISNVKDNMEKKATSIINAPLTKKVVKKSLSDLKPTINKKTGKKFVSKKK